jgi:hypothetical protein
MQEVRTPFVCPAKRPWQALRSATACNAHSSFRFATGFGPLGGVVVRTFSEQGTTGE